jgi:hypothetical protein
VENPLAALTESRDPRHSRSAASLALILVVPTDPELPRLALVRPFGARSRIVSNPRHVVEYE